VSDLERADPGKGQAAKYSLLVADTFLVPAEQGKPAECLTNNAPRTWADVAYYFKVCPCHPAWLASLYSGGTDFCMWKG